MAKCSKEQMKDDEKKVLAELQKNCNVTIDRIARHCGFSRQKVWRIMKQLNENHVIWGYSAIVDEGHYGLKKFIMFFKRSTKTFDKKAAEEVNLDKLLGDYKELDIRIESSYYIHGDYDWIIIFTAKDLGCAKKFINVIIDNYPGLIEKLHLGQVLYSPRNHYVVNPVPLKAKDIP